MLQFKGDLNSKDNPELNWDIDKIQFKTDDILLENIKLEGNYRRKCKKQMSFFHRLIS